MRLLPSCLAAVFCVLSVFGSGAAQAQTTTPTSSRLRILTIGSFLGQFDGFCEDPGGTYDLESARTPYAPCLPGGPGGPSGRAAPADAAAKGQRWPAALGGLLGARRWLDEERALKGGPEPLLLLTGNNQLWDFGSTSPVPAPSRAADAAYAAQTKSRDVALRRSDLFWREVAALRPTAVALGPEDFIRSLRTSPEGRDATAVNRDAARRFVEWVRDGRNPPFLASNAVVTITKPGLNTIDHGPYELMIDEDSSIDWVGSLTLQHPCDVTPSVVLDESRKGFGEGVAFRAVAIDTDTGDVCRNHQETTITIKEGALLPARHYRLRVTVERSVRDFFFRTHEVLTPPRAPAAAGVAASAAAIREALAEYPILLTPTGTGEDAIVVSLSPTSTADGLGTEAWRFPVEPSKADRKRDPYSTIAFLSPAAALDSVLRRVAALKGGAPLVILLSSLGDDETSELLEKYPEIRMVILPADSLLLGRAARASEDGASDPVASTFSRRLRPRPHDPDTYGGDLGLGAVVNAHEPQATLLIGRPEWIGETGVAMTATLSRNPFGEWRAEAADVTVRTIPGDLLNYSVAADGVRYWPGDRTDLTVGPYTPYHAVPIENARGNDANFIDLWKTGSSFAAAAGEAVRERLHGDVAIVPADLMDGDVLGWLTHALSRGRTDWLSRYILERATFRSYRFVRADVAGSEMLDTLTKALSDPLDVGVKGCAIGLGPVGCPATLDKGHPEHVRVRGRALVPTVSYTLVLPERMAEKLELSHDHDVEHGYDVLDVLSAFLANGAWKSAAHPAPPPLPADVENRARNETRSYLNVRSLEVGYSRTRVSEPGGRRGVLENLQQIEFSGTRPERNRSGKIDADLAFFERRRRALRLLTLVDFSKREVFDADGVAAATYPKDQFSVGLRYEQRYITRTGAFEYRPFLGAFWEGQFRHSVTAMKASGPAAATRTDFTATQQASFPTPLTIPPSRYLFGTVGLDVLPAAKDVIPLESMDASVNRLSASFASGRRDHVLNGLTLADEAQSIDDFLAQGGSALLDAYFASHPATFGPDVQWGTDFRTATQQRLQIDADGDLTLKFWKRSHKLNLGVRFRKYEMREAADLSLATEWKVSTKLVVPIHRQLELVPAFEYQRATLNADADRAFAMRRFEIRFNVPFFVRFGRGGFFH